MGAPADLQAYGVSTDLGWVEVGGRAVPVDLAEAFREIQQTDRPVDRRRAVIRPPGRLHDLPVTWDGHPVTWRGWESDRTSLDYHLPLDESRLPRLRFARGPAWSTPASCTSTAPGTSLRLFAFRCADCQVDQVYDVDSDRLWDLDDTDYGPAGSVDPGPSDPLAAELEPQAEAAPERPAASSTPGDGLRESPGRADRAQHLPRVRKADRVGDHRRRPQRPGQQSLQPFDPREDLAGRIAITQPVARGRLLARALHKGENIDRPLEYAGMTHFATCPVGAHPAPPIALLEHQTRHLSRRSGRRR
ncbi:hypothetical protein G5V59_27090 [Nocardioides sp. W3-2-3]|uniref:hypothetical protein n=1 Tax=Nocardioides convexus TaxID=2712224 RepID=UPI0024184998|nr:hypothetical protein [Nocardioides convexus]NHA02059.1 hypothetical protein [Nocardioides convexus]